jgi:hypothetical protein
MSKKSRFGSDKQRKAAFANMSSARMNGLNAGRTPQALNRDLSIRASNTLPYSNENVRQWKGNERYYDLEGIDTPPTIQTLNDQMPSAVKNYGIREAFFVDGELHITSDYDIDEKLEKQIKKALVVEKPESEEKFSQSSLDEFKKPQTEILVTGKTYMSRRDIKALGGKWNKDEEGWVVPSGKRDQIEKLAKERGFEIDDYEVAEGEDPFRRLNAADRLAIREDKLLTKADRLQSKASNKQSESDARLASADNISKRFYMGQPILVGHHSEAGARRDQAKMWNHTEKGIRAQKEAEEAKDKAERTRKYADYYTHSPTVIKGRIKKAEAELKKQENSIKKADKTIKQMEAANKKSPGYFSEVDFKHQDAEKSYAQRKIPDVKEDIESLKSLIPDSEMKAKSGLTIQDLAGSKMKNKIGATKVAKQYHNKNLRGGNFSINIRDGGKLYELTGNHDPDGVITHLTFNKGAWGREGSYGNIITKENYQSMDSSKIYSIVKAGIEDDKTQGVEA